MNDKKLEAVMAECLDNHCLLGSPLPKEGQVMGLCPGCPRSLVWRRSARFWPTAEAYGTGHAYENGRTCSRPCGHTVSFGNAGQV